MYELMEKLIYVRNGDSTEPELAGDSAEDFAMKHDEVLLDLLAERKDDDGVPY